MRVGVLRSGKVVWRFILEINVIISVGLSFRNLRNLRPPGIFAKIITTGVRTEHIKDAYWRASILGKVIAVSLRFLGLRS